MLSSWIYARAPLWLQNVGISLYGLGYRRERLGGEFPRYVEGYREREGWGREQLGEYVRHELRALVAHAAENVPYYRAKWGGGDFTRFDVADLRRLPLTPKADLRGKPEAFVSEAAGPLRGLRRYYTSGSTGTPLTIYCTPDDHRRFIAAREARSFGWAGASVRMPRSMIGGRMIVTRHDAPAPYYRWNWAERQVYFSGYHIKGKNAANYVEGFNRYQPLLLTGYANAHYQLARFMLEERLHLNYRPRALVLSSEKLTPEMKTTLYAAFGARAYEEFGAVENCVLATECEHGRLHANPDFGVIEIVDDSGEPVRRGEIGRMICTGLANHTQPLIRYDIGDLAAWSTEECPCGRNHLPVLDPVVGRLEDVIVGHDGQVTVRFHGLFVNLPNVMEGQVIQEDLDRIRVRVVARDGFSQKDEETIRRRLREERLGPVQVEVERVAQIERTERGKFRAVINRLPREVIEKALRGGRAAGLRPVV